MSDVLVGKEERARYARRIICGIYNICKIKLFKICRNIILYNGFWYLSLRTSPKK